MDGSLPPSDIDYRSELSLAQYYLGPPTLAQLRFRTFFPDPEDRKGQALALVSRWLEFLNEEVVCVCWSCLLSGIDDPYQHSVVVGTDQTIPQSSAN